MKRALGILIAICAVGSICLPAHADTATATTEYSIYPGTITASPGGTGAFDVLFTNTGSASLSVAAFSFEVSVDDPDITLTYADYSTVAGGPAYIFTGDSLFQDISSPLEFCNLANLSCPDQTLDAADVTADALGITVGAGGSADLGEVFFSVAPGATPGVGVANLTFTGEVSDIANANNLADPSGDAIIVDSFTGGTITIASPVPEPPSLLLALSGMAVAMIAASARKRLGHAV
jgi:hypothetical protein